MLILSVATHDERMISVYKASCEKNNCELVLLGYGEQWKGFGWRWKVILKYLKEKEIAENELIVITDAFDSVVVASSTVIEKKFREFKSPMVFSCEPVASNFQWISAYYRRRVFGPDPIINGGSYMGYAGAIKKFISRIKFKDNTDDQRFLTSLYKHVHMSIDYNHELFYHHCAWMKPSLRGHIPTTCIITFPASGYTLDMLEKLGYNVDDTIMPKETCKECVQIAIRRVKHYGPFFWRETIVIISLILGLGTIPLILGLIV